MTAGQSFILNQFSAGISDAIDLGDWGGIFGDVLEWGIEGVIYGGVEAVVYGGDFLEGAKASAISSAKFGMIGYLGGRLGVSGNPNDPTDPCYGVNSFGGVIKGVPIILKGGRWAVNILKNAISKIKGRFAKKPVKERLPKGVKT
jgi:hypothetical protein